MQSCWEILGIEKTKDKLAIKRAYTNLAHSISPEDDPEGFKRIHSAYKQAMMYASDKENKSFAPPVENKNFQNTESVHRNTKPHQDSGTEEEFDFSNIIVEDDEFSQEVERILDSIDELKASHALDSADYIERWNSSTLDAVSISMFNLYSALYKETEDGSIWDSFFDEPL
jgi:DnaJ-class molecular chaperone